MKPIRPQSYSEHEELKAVILCRPAEVSITDPKVLDEVRWSGAVHVEKATEEFSMMKQALEEAQVEVIEYSSYLSENDQALSQQLIHRVFVRDLACVFGTTMIPGKAGIFMRKPEYMHSHVLFQDWFPDSFQIRENNDLKALEFGDVMVLNKDAVLINAGMRTSIDSVEQIKQTIFASGFSEIAVINLPRNSDTMHLDMNGNVAGGDVFIAKAFMRHFPVYVSMEAGARYEMLETFLRRHGFDIHWLQQYESLPDFNYLNLNPETLLISKAAHKQRLKQHQQIAKLQFIEVEVSELEKAGGGIRCMTLPLVRKG
ncbi:arginine deiminase family protein [Oceanobacillus sp. 1P07AA]|uniref:arginine deiminase family protein n=1 Tax=Oceanobacillus sp. 1P07AA TaxID=3132293 RepID=UPI0039A64888